MSTWMVNALPLCDCVMFFADQSAVGMQVQKNHVAGLKVLYFHFFPTSNNSLL